MDQFPLHFDGSTQPNFGNDAEEASESFEITDEMRKYISANPFEYTVTA